MKYVAFTTKHIGGFCMFDSKYTDYDIMNTPYGKDITKQVASAFRNQGLAVGFYYYPDDWYYRYKTGHTGVYRIGPPVSEFKTPFGPKQLTLLEYGKKQIEEMLNNYGKIDLMWYGGKATGVKKFTWELDPSIIIVKSEIPTPHPPWEYIPEDPPEGAWEVWMPMSKHCKI